MGSIVYSDSRLHHTANNDLDCEIIVYVLTDLFNAALKNQSLTHETEYAFRVIGLHNKLTRLKSNFTNIPDTWKAVNSLSLTQIEEAAHHFNGDEWRESFYSVCRNFNLNPDRFTVMLLRLMDELDTFGAVLVHASDLGIATDQQWKELTACQNLLLYNPDTDKNELSSNLKGIYRYITKQIQSIAGVIDETKADERVCGFWAKLINILVREQSLNDDYCETQTIERMFDILNKNFTGKQYEVTEGVPFPGVQSALKKITELGGDCDEFLAILDALNLKTILAIHSNNLFINTPNAGDTKVIACLSPSLTIYSDLIYKLTKKHLKQKLIRLTSLSTAPKHILDSDEIVIWKIYEWINTITSALLKRYIRGKLTH